MANTYGPAFKYIDGYEMPFSTPRTRKRAACPTEFLRGFGLFVLHDCIVSPLKAFFATPEVTVYEPIPVSHKADIFYTPEPHTPPTPKKSINEHLMDLDISKLAHFGFATWIGFSASFFALAGIGLI